MKFSVDKRIFESFPGAMVGFAVADSIDNSGESPEIMALLAAQQERVKMEFTPGALKQHPKINSWREAYRKFGAKPKDYQSSVENLCRRAIEGEKLRHISKLVDAYNYISLKYMLPAGGEDLGKIQGDVSLTFAGPAETALALLGEKEARAPKEGEVIYKDGISAICRRWNWKEAERTKLTEQTKRCILVVECLPPVAQAEMGNALLELSTLVERACGASVKYSILDGNSPEAEL